MFKTLHAADAQEGWRYYAKKITDEFSVVSVLSIILRL